MAAELAVLPLCGRGPRGLEVKALWERVRLVVQAYLIEFACSPSIVSLAELVFLWIAEEENEGAEV